MYNILSIHNFFPSQANIVITSWNILGGGGRLLEGILLGETHFVCNIHTLLSDNPDPVLSN